MGVWSAPAAPQTLPNGGGLHPPPTPHRLEGFLACCSEVSNAKRGAPLCKAILEPSCNRQKREGVHSCRSDRTRLYIREACDIRDLATSQHVGSIPTCERGCGEQEKARGIKETIYIYIKSESGERGVRERERDDAGVRRGRRAPTRARRTVLTAVAR